MKTLFATSIALSLILLVGMIVLGASWHFQGHGLHPALAACGGLFAALAGYWSASVLERLEA
jgi:hypothetical protein